MTYEQAIKNKDAFAHAAETLSRRLGFRANSFYHWAKRHNVDLIGKGHLIIANHSKTLEAFLNDTGLTL